MSGGRFKTPVNAQRGFTLLEVILAMAVGAIVILAIQTVFFSALRLRNTSERRVDSELALHRTLELVKRDFAGLMIPGGVLAADFQTATTYTMNPAVSGERVSAEFFTNSGRIDYQTPFADAQRVAYYLSPEPGTQAFELTRTITRNLLSTREETPEIQPLLGGVQAAYFEYFDGSGWTASWDSTVTSTLPTAVRLTLQLAGEPNSTQLPAPIDFIVPIAATMAASTTTTLDTATP